jgi:bacteriorhodopsin
MVKTTTQISVVLQVLIGIISTKGIFFKVDKKHKILTQILTIETIVQYIELCFYIYFLKHLDGSSLSTITCIRYYDWFFTTPTMLISTILYFKYEEHMENNKPGTLDLFTVFKEEQSTIIEIVVSNFLMLLFGYLGEKNKINKKIGIPLGFLFFANTFNIIYKKYAVKSTNGKKIFNIILPIWGMYGIAAYMNDVYKNNMINILDVFAKNFFSLFIYYKLEAVSLK